MFMFTPLFVSAYVLTVADSIPAFDTRKTCQGAEVAAVNPGRTVETCVQKEEAARDQLKKSWSRFPAADKAQCASAGKIGGPPSYIELLTCLEMAGDVKNIRTLPETTGVGDADGSRRKGR